MMDDVTKIDEAKPFSKDVFLDAMSRVPQAVFIVTTDGVEGKAGLTATAVTSVSADPPSLLVCLNAANFSTMAFYKNKRITVNSLEGDHTAIAALFGRSAAKDLTDPTPEQLREASEKRFNGDDWEFADTPILRGARAVFECEISDVKLVDTHLVVFAKVLNVRFGEVNPALVYLERGYKTV
jgi:flavin reductase (DIM6/NTAB) family NADH-FMN oxidoreductase RutF